MRLQSWAAFAVIEEVVDDPGYYLDARQSSDEEGQEGNDIVCMLTCLNVAILRLLKLCES